MVIREDRLLLDYRLNSKTSARRSSDGTNHSKSACCLHATIFNILYINEIIISIKSGVDENLINQYCLSR